MVKVAVVTGSNKGIGFAIVRGLCKQFDGHVYLTSRDVGRGENAVKELQKEGLEPHFHQLDVEDKSSIEKLKSFLLEKYGGLDVLVNNAGIAYKNDSKAPFAEQAEVTLKCNFWGLLDCCQILFPILKPHARVVHVSSFVTFMALSKCSEAKKKELLLCESIEDVCQKMTSFVSEVKSGTFKELGWPETAYGMSKVGVSLLTPIQQKIFDKDTGRTDIVVNCCCPGYVATDMSSHKGKKTIDEGADTPIYLSLLPPSVDSPRGKFVTNRKIAEIDDQNIANYMMFI